MAPARPGHPGPVGGTTYSGEVTPADETLLDLALSRATVDRSAAARATDDGVPRALQNPQTRVVDLRDGAAAVLPGPPARLVLRPPEPADRSRGPWFLGRQDGVTYLAVDHGTGPAPSVPAVGAGEGADGAPAWLSLRQVGADLDDTDAGLLTTATALAEWHRRHGYCPRCGSPTQVEQGGWVRRCSTDGSEHYPRTDPAVIMAVVDCSDRILLGTGLPWPSGRVSVLAGFVEAGESLEAAVVREVREEVGLQVSELLYRGNQPWPFPASLMLGFQARTDQTELRVDPAELRHAAWYTREELRAGVTEGRLTLPSRVSIARRLIEEWFGGPVPEPPGRRRQ